MEITVDVILVTTDLLSMWKESKRATLLAKLRNNKICEKHSLIIKKNLKKTE
jgi:hypothetical protein